MEVGQRRSSDEMGRDGLHTGGEHAPRWGRAGVRPGGCGRRSGQRTSPSCYIYFIKYYAYGEEQLLSGTASSHLGYLADACICNDVHRTKCQSTNKC